MILQKKSGMVNNSVGSSPNFKLRTEYKPNPNQGKVYLQPDPTLKITDKIISTTIPKANGGYETQQHKTGEIAKGLLTNSEAGYNSYFVTDNPSVKNSKETYFVTRGSDGISVENLNDWVNNNANFTLFNAYIPQAKLAEKAMEVVCEETVTNF